MSDLLFDVENHVATITLNRPDQLNAFSEEMLNLWIDALKTVRDCDNIYAAVLTGAGRAFCAGGDVGAMASGQGFYSSDEDMTSTALARKNSLWKKVQHIPMLMEEIDKPIIAKINGVAVGAGLDMALMCDIRVASTNAKVCEGYIKVGIVPGDGAAYFLPPLVGLDKALDMLWTARMLNAEEAKQAGLITFLVTPEELDGFVDDYAHKLAHGPQQAIMLTKRAVRQSLRTDLRTSLDLVSSYMGIVTELDDYKERVQTIMKKK